MTTFGMDEWLTAGRTLLDAPIPAEQYMDLILERQRVYEAAHPPVKWVRTLPEWFCWPSDDDFVILPDRTTAPKPEPTRTDADRLANRARYLRKSLPTAKNQRQTDRIAGELAAIRWALRIIDADWDLALEQVPRPEGADLDPEEDQ